MQTNFERLQKQYPLFRYVAASGELSAEGLTATFQFEIGEHKFSPSLTFRGVTSKMLDKLGEATVRRFVFHLGLAEIPSYWKLTCSPTIAIDAGQLSDLEIAFWRKLIEKGMGEFFFVNDITPFAPQISVKYTDSRPRKALDLNMAANPKRVVVPVGGGKDSIVTMELLVKAGKDLTFLTIGRDKASEDIIGVFTGKYGHKPQIEIDRRIDPTMLELNARGYLNGHTPFSSIVAFSSLFAASLFGLPYIALSNEKSANEETGTYNGVNINHQYSKTFEFESDFRAYVQLAFPGAPTYFSLLRPLYEIQIMRLFTRYPEYFPVFRSCNIGKKTNSWCGDCGKCLFVFLLLSAFLPPGTVTGIFGKDLLNDPELVPLLKQLTGEAEMKAFECVGTRDETMAALFLTSRRRGKEDPLPVILAAVSERLKEKSWKTLASELLRNFDSSNLIPPEFVGALRHEIK